MTHESFMIGEKTYARIAYGNEEGDWGADHQPCRHCRVTRGDLHKVGCFTERCPCCGGQAMTCCCPYDEAGLPRRPISSARQRFYKVFYLVLLPLFCLGVIRVPFGVRVPAAIIVAVPVLLLIVFYRKMGPMELSQVVPIPPPEEGSRTPQQED